MSKNSLGQQSDDPDKKRAKLSAPFHAPKQQLPSPTAPLPPYAPFHNPIDSRTATTQAANSFAPVSVGGMPLMSQPSLYSGARPASGLRPLPRPAAPAPMMPSSSSFASSATSATPQSLTPFSFPPPKAGMGSPGQVVNMWQDNLPPYNPATGSNLVTPSMMATHPYNAQVFNRLLTGREAFYGMGNLKPLGVVANPRSFGNNFGASRTFDLPSVTPRLSPFTHVGNHGFSDYRYNQSPRGTLAHSERLMGADLLDRLMQQNPGHFPHDEITRPWALTRTPRGDGNRDALSVLASPAQANQYRGALEKAGVGINMGSERAFCPECKPWYENLAPKGSKGFHVINPQIYQNLAPEEAAKKIESRIPDIQQNWFSLIRGMSDDWNIGDLTNSLARVPNLPSIGSPGLGGAAGPPAASSSSSSYNPLG